MQPWLSNIRNDVTGGLVSAAVVVPLAMGFGMFAFAALGDDFFAIGALAALYGALIVALAGVLLGDRTGAIYTPGINSTFFLGILLYNIVHTESAFLRAGGPPLMLTILFLVVLLAGAFKVLFGAIKLGSLIKYAPHPVMAGFQNTAAILLFLVQLAGVFGFDHDMAFIETLKNIDAAKPLSLFVAAVTIVAMWSAPRALPRLPPLIVGLAAGILLYYVLVLAGFGEQLGPVIGHAPSATLRPTVIPDFITVANTSEFITILPTIVGAAFALAIIASIETLLAAKLVTPPGAAKADGDRVIMRLGAGNMAAACFGGITSGLSTRASAVNRAFGGRTPLSVLVNAAAILVVIAALFPVVVQMPRVALAAALMVVAVQHFDAWTVRHIGRVMSGSAHYRRSIVLELLVMLTVAILSIAVSIVLAVFVGVAIAVVLFLLRMSRSVIRQQYRCNDVHSRKSRTLTETQTLEKDGAAILVMRLYGVLFFGSAEKLANEIDAAIAQQDTHYVILDLRRVTDIDNSGAQTLMEIAADLAPQDKHLILALAKNSESYEHLADFGVLDAVTAAKVFPDIDRAIEWAEDDLLRGRVHADAADKEVPLDRVSMLAGFAPDEIAAIGKHLSRVVYSKGSAIFREGDPGSEMFIVVKGTASARIQQEDGGDIRLGTFAPGTVFGELAILDRGTRSATVVADNDLVCHVLSESGFAALSTQTPSVAIKLLANLGRELSGRLRLANQTIHQLEI